MDHHSKYFTQFLSYLKVSTGKEASISDAIFHRQFAEQRQKPFPDDPSRTWLSVLLREGMTDSIRRQLYPSRLDLGHSLGNRDQNASLRDLLAEINKHGEVVENRPMKLRGEKSQDITKSDLGTVLKGLTRLTGRDVGRSVEQPLTNLKVIKLMYRLTKERMSHLFSFIARPSEPDGYTQEFQDSYPDTRNVDGTLLFADLLCYTSAEISAERQAYIDSRLPVLAETLLEIEKKNEVISLALSKIYVGDKRAKSLAYRKLAASIDAYVHYDEPSVNPMDEVLYTHLRTLRFTHYAGTFREAINKSKIRLEPVIASSPSSGQTSEVTPVLLELANLYRDITERTGLAVAAGAPVTSINQFNKFVKEWKPLLVSLVGKATGLPTDARGLDNIVERACRVLHMFTGIFLREKDLDAVWLTPLDCVAALCVIRHEQHAQTKYKPWWHGRLKDKGDTLLRALMEKRPIEEVYEEDFIPFGINQILYHRWCYMLALLVSEEDYECLDAWMVFQAARIEKYAQCMQSGDIDVISKSLAKFDQYCLRMDVRIVSLESVNSWLELG